MATAIATAAAIERHRSPDASRYSQIIPTTWSIVPSSAQLGWSAKKKFFMLVPKSVRGSFDSIDGSIIFYGESPTMAKVDLRIPLTSQSSGNATRDKHMLTEAFFDAETYPDLSFVSTEIRVAGHQPNTYEVDGILIARGVSRPITLTGTFTHGTDQTRAHVSLTGHLNRQDYGLSWNGEPFIKLLDTIDLEIEVDLLQRPY